MTLELVDLLELRYAPGGTDRRTGVDCLWAVRQVAERIFPDLEAHELPLVESEARAALAAWSGEGARWELVGRNWFESDAQGLVLLGCNDEHTWCAITVDERGRYAVTANPERGVFRAATRSLEGLEAIYRRRA